MNSIIEKVKPFVVQLATPYATGTGFYVPQFQLVVTNEHVISGCKDVVVQDSLGKRYSSKIVLIDKHNDLAFIQPAILPKTPFSELLFEQKVEIGKEIIALGHPYGLTFSSTYGIVSNTSLEINGIYYIMHDAALNPGNSGGPLINKEGKVVGVNSSIFKEGKNIGVALQSNLILKSLKAFKESGFEKATQCHICQQLIEDTHGKNNSCTNCGVEVQLISNFPDYKPVGIAKKIEDIITRLSYVPLTCRRGQLSWELTKGSATIMINYHTKSGYLSAESNLCKIPSSNTLDLYEFLLEANYKTPGLTFSTKENSVILSLLIYDQHLHEETALTLFRHLLKTSDDYDDVLVNKFNALWHS
jgi:serine protease Do